MDLVANMLETNLKQLEPAIEIVRLRPPMRRRFTAANADRPRALFNGDRLINRFWDYPQWIRRLQDNFDLFHLVDHSYSQLIHELPAFRTVVTCHDLDAFRCILRPLEEKRSMLFRAMARRTLSGFQKAARVTCPTASIRDELLLSGLMPGTRISVVPNGVDPIFSSLPDGEADLAAEQLLGPPNQIELLHVGTTIQRKRIDVLLRVFAAIREQFPNSRLIQVGGTYSAEQMGIAEELKLRDGLVVLPRLDTELLAAVYRRASLTLLPSEREGFGLPVVESMASGTPIVASDIPVLREVGKRAAVYCPVGNVSKWSTTVLQLLRERLEDNEAWATRRKHCTQRASDFTWREYSQRMMSIYSELLDTPTGLVAGEES
jgi:glycosyltransferase involved in cell wall biosynthesis